MANRCPFRHFCLVGVISSLFVFFGPFLQAAPPALTTLQSIHRLSNQEAANAIPVDFEATIVYSRGYERLLFVQDGNAAIFVSSPTSASWRTGDRVLIKGRTQRSFRPLVVASSIALLHHGPLPKPVPATFPELIRAELDCRLVTLKAVVRAADLVLSAAAPVRSTRLQLQLPGGHVEANIDSDDSAKLRSMLDDEVEIAGVAAGKFDDKMQLTGVVIYVSSLADVRIVKHMEAKHWTLPVTPMDQVLPEYDVVDRSQRLHVRGTITYYRPGTAVVLQEGPKSLWIETHTSAPLRIGDLADATGFPHAQDRILTLTDAEIQDRQIFLPVSPFKADWHQLAFWDSSKPTGHQNDLVEIEGRVVTETREASQDEYVLSSNGRLFTAIYHHPRLISELPAMPQIPLGSRIRVTGICTMLDTNAVNPGEEVPFNIQLRSFDDIAVLSGPSWLSVRHLLIVVGVLIVLLFAAGARSWIVQHRVRRQNARSAYIERQRGRILEDINGERPLVEILEAIPQLASFTLSGATCWCQLENGSRFGLPPASLESFRVTSVPIRSHNGSPHGTLSAAFHPKTKASTNETEALGALAGLAGLAIDTRRLYSDLQHRSQFDLLTETQNRFSMEQYFDELVNEARLQAGIFGLVYIDLDHFKQVNDVYGHLVGDLYLQQVSRRMKHQLRSQDMLARLGGDEFAVLAPRVHSRAEVEDIANRLERVFDEPFLIEGKILKGSGSIGIALYPEDGENRETLLHVADTAMYKAKQASHQKDELAEGLHKL